MEKGIAFLILILLNSCFTENTLEKKEVILKDTLAVEPKVPVVIEPVIGAFEQSLIDQGLVNIQKLDSSLLVELKYSTTDNFFKQDVYEELTNAYLPYDVAQDLRQANDSLKAAYPSFRLLIYDAVRPHLVQEILWNALDSIRPAVRKSFVADPAAGSLHNYGCAVDLTIYDLAADSVLDMGTIYDYFGHLAYPRKEQEMLDAGRLSPEQIANRELLRATMQKAGFKPISSEWWHFNITTLAKAKLKYRLIE